MQDEFKKSDKISVKMIKSKQESTKRFISNENKTTKIIEKKKKDVILIDSKSDYTIDSSNDKLLKINEVLSIFNREILENKNANLDKIDSSTGLPPTFKIENIEEKMKTSNKIKMENNKKYQLKSSVFKEKFETDEYKSMHLKNLDVVNNLSEDEIIKYTQELKASIPKELLDKMKSGYFQKNLDTKSLVSAIYNQTNQKDSEVISEDESVESADFTEKPIVKENINKSHENSIFVFNYYNKFKKISSCEVNNNSLKGIDYMKENLGALNLNEKYFTLKEISNFLSSTLDSHISIGLKFLSYIFDLYYSLETNKDLKSCLITSEKELNLFVILIHLIQSKNKSIRIKSIEIVHSITFKLIRKHTKLLKQEVFHFSNFPIIIHNFTNFIFESNREKEFLEEIIVIIPRLMTNLKNDFCNISNYVKNYELSVFIKFFKTLCLINQNLGNIFYNSEIMTKLLTIYSEMIIEKEYIVCKKVTSLLFYMTFTDINKLRIILDKLYKTTTKMTKEHLSLILKFEYMHLIYENRCYNKEYLIYITDEFFNSKNKIIYSRCILKLINEENFIYFSNFSHKFLEFSQLRQSIYHENKNTNNLSVMLNSILVNMKLFRYMQNREEDISLVSNEKELNKLIELFNDLTEDLIKTIPLIENEKSTEECNIIFNHLDILLKLIATSKKYPKMISFFKMRNLDLKKLYEATSKYLFLNYEKMNDMKKEERIYFLVKIKNSINFSYNLHNYLTKFRSENNPILSLNIFPETIFLLPTFINCFEQCRLFRFCSILQNYLIYKMEKFEELKTFYVNIKYDIRSIIEEIYLYISSNEELRRSKILNNLMYYNEKISHVIFEITEKDLIFLPFEKNFLLQMLFKDNYDSEAKLKVMSLIILIYSSDKGCFFNYIENYDFFIILIKTFNSFKDVIWKNKAELIFSHLITSLILKPKLTQFTKRTSRIMSGQDIDMLLEDLCFKYDLPNVNSNTAFFAKLLLVMFSLLDNVKINKFNFILMTNFAIFEEFFEESNLVNEEDILRNIINNKDIIFLDFIENLIVIDRKYFSRNLSQKYSKNIIFRVILAIKKLINLENLDSIEVVRSKIREYLTN